MSESSEEKTEEPTERKLENLRKKGQVPQSKDLMGAAGFITIIMILWVFSGNYIELLIEMFKFPNLYLHLDLTSAVSEVIPAVGKTIFIIIIPIMLSSVVSIIVFAILQNGVIFSLKPITPDPNRLNPLNNLKQMFSRAKLVELMKTLLKSCLFLTAVFFIVKSLLVDFLQIPFFGINGLLHNISSSLLLLFVVVALIYLAIAVIDVFVQKKLFLHQNKMTKYEIKKDAKEDGGDPAFVAQRREFAMEIVNSIEIEKQIPKANVIVTNPTNIAVALYYSREVTGLPKVIAKGRLKVAKAIIKVAMKSDVPIVQNVPLARELYKKVKVNNYIPNELFLPVAEVLRWVYLQNSFKQIK